MKREPGSKEAKSEATLAIVGLALMLVGGEIAHSGLGVLVLGVALFAGALWS